MRLRYASTKLRLVVSAVLRAWMGTLRLARPGVGVATASDGAGASDAVSEPRAAIVAFPSAES